MRTRRLSAGLSLAVATVLGVLAMGAGPAAAVADGTPAAPGQYPFAVRLTMTGIPLPDGSSYASACSAALISPTWIVTAGHCFHDANRVRVSGPAPYPTTATLNTVDLNRSPGEARTVVAVRQSASADVALAQLDRPVTDVRPLALATARPAAGQLLTIAGWGATSSTGPPSTRLMTGVVRVTGVAPSTVLVTGYSPARDTSACPYDSGAPYVRTPTGQAPRLVSVESSGPNCPHAQNETTARIDPLVPWIRGVVPGLP
jgi:secreted trypsin-like serine protease